MDTSLQRADLTEGELHPSLEAHTDVAQGDGGGHHIHLPNPSFWPVLLNIAIIVAIAGMLFIPENPWLTIIAVPFVVIGILGWALEDPMASPRDETSNYDPKLTSEQVLELARETIDRTVTISSTAYSTHPVTVELDDVQGDRVVLALYGKVELEAQRDAIEDAMWQLPNVVNVRNFIVAEDAILNLAYARIESLREKGKLEGAHNISVLVENYILSLYGDVPTPEMKMMLERELIGISGVRVVVNHIGLNEDIPGNLGRTRNKI
jgi:hypothetical protein